jgi:tRNA(Arg) A34 adenosine deaminase TadA
MKKVIHHAIKAANKSSFKHRMGAIILHKGKIISRGFNQGNKTHPNGPSDRYYSLHAEIHAISLAKNKGDTLIVVRVKKDGKLALSKPCSGCMEAIKAAGIKCIIYTDNKSDIQILEL